MQADRTAGAGLIGVAYLQQQLRMAQGDQGKKLADFVGKYPDPEAVDSDFVTNLLAVSRTHIRNMEAKGEEVPAAVFTWRQVAFARYERELQPHVDTWRAVAQSGLHPTPTQLRAAEGTDAYPEMVDAVRAFDRLFPILGVMGSLMDMGGYASEIEGADLWDKHFVQDPDISKLWTDHRAAMEIVGEADWREPAEMRRLSELSKTLSAQARDQVQARATTTTGRGYGEAAQSGAGTSRSGGQTPPSVAIRLGKS